MENQSSEDAYNIELTDENLLGEGSYGQVYKIKRKIDGLTCAAKLFKIPLHLMDTNEQLGCKKESKILKQAADHPFIIQFIEEFPYKQKNLCIVTKFANGGDLEKLMRKQQNFTEDEALEYFAMLLLGLDFLHSKNIFHRDLKPGNIFINELSNGEKLLCIGDFGISKYDLDTIKQTQTTFGYNTTPLYKAPEIINMKEPTSKVDIWAAGIIFYQLLASKHPFQKNEFIQTLLSIKDLEYDPLPQNISPSTKKLVALVLQKDPDSRPDAKSFLQMEEIQVAVERLLQKICVTDRKMAAKLIDEHKITWISPDLMKQDQVQLALEALAKLQLQLLSQNCQKKEQIMAAIDQLRSDKIFDYSSEEEVSVLLKKISGTEDILLEIATKFQKQEEITSLKGKIQSLEYAQSLKDLEIAQLKKQVRDLQSKIEEEEKESPAQKESSPFQLSKPHPCFNFYKNLESLNMPDLQIKMDYKYTIRHPYMQWYDPPRPIEEIPQVEVTLKMCTLYKAQPYGLVHIQYTDNGNKWLSFEGVGVFTEGQLHMGPFTCITGNGWGLSYSVMMNGRPADNHHHTQFNPVGNTLYVDSLKTVTNVSGWQGCSTKLQQGLYHGNGKIWLTNARMFIGDFWCQVMNEGQLFELQEGNTFSVYQVKYNPQEDVKLGVKCSDQKPIEKNLMSSGHIDLSDLSKKKQEGFFEKLFGSQRNRLRT